MKKIFNWLQNNWLALIIILQPILDIFSYFQQKNSGSSFTWIIRFLCLIVIFFVTFVKCKKKAKYLMVLFPMVVFFLFHLINLYRIHSLFIVEEIKYYIFTYQTIALAIMLIFYVKEYPKQISKIKIGMLMSFFIMLGSIFLAYITNSYVSTYEAVGITGWFSSANTASMILCALTPFAMFYFFKKDNPYIYGIVGALAFMGLYTNGTRACYYTLVATILVLVFCGITSKEIKHRIIKITMTILLLCFSFYFYDKSFMSHRKEDVSNTNSSYKGEVEEIQKDPAFQKPTDILDGSLDKPGNTIKVDGYDIDLSQKDMIVAILETSYIYKNLIELHGSDAVIKALRKDFKTSDLSNNRYCKVINARIHYDSSDFFTRLFGFGYGVIGHESLDMENDLTAIFYYYGYIGIIMYIIYLCYFLLKMIKYFFKHFSIIRDSEFIFLGFIFILLIFGGEYSGAFLRKSNANIYLSLYLVFIYFKCLGKERKSNKITFLNLHLGSGGIEVATINSANALSTKYDVEIISFYKMNQDYSYKLNDSIKVKYLYIGEPNKKAFNQAIKACNLFKILKEGMKATYILLFKKVGFICAIQDSSSKIIVSTRWDLSILLSKFKSKDTIAIAQEHHHHNGNKKYIKTLQKKYKRINYLFALTKSLEKDYRGFLSGYNNDIKIKHVPNMININNKKKSTLKNLNLISVGRLHDGKRFDEMVRVFSKLKNKNAKLYIIGDGDEKDKIKELVTSLNLNKRVVMTGNLNELEQEKYYLDSCLFLMTSITEGLPMVLLEAMSHGLPCVAYETESGVLDIIHDDKNGYVIKNRSEKDFIEKVDDLLKNTKKLNELSKNTVSTVELFDKENILKTWASIIDKEMVYTIKK